MRNIQKTLGMAKYFIFAAFFAGSTFFASCSDATNPLDVNATENVSVLTGEDGRNTDKEVDDRKKDDKKEDDRKDSDKNKKGLPIDCFKLTREQMSLFQQYQLELQRSNEEVKKSYSGQINEIKMAEKRQMSELLIKERELKKQLAELRKNTDNSDARLRFNQLQREAKAKIEEIRKAERTEREAIMRQVKAGEITREAASELLNALKANTKAQIEVIITELKEARKALEESV